jgi:hypothetical protein
MPNKAMAAEADAIAREVLTPEAIEKIEQTALLLRTGHDTYLVLRLLYGTAYMDGMIAMAKVGVPQ